MTRKCPFSFEENDFIFLGKRGNKLKAEIIQKEIRKIRNTFRFMLGNLKDHIAQDLTI